MYLVALDVLLAALGVLIGLSCGSAGLTAVAVLSVADMLSFARPRKEGLGDDYASLAVAVFIIWAGVSLVMQGIQDTQIEVPVHPLALITVVILICTKLALVWRRSYDWMRGHHVNDSLIMGLVLLSYLVTLLTDVYLESGLVVMIGVLVLYEAVELISEAVQEIWVGDRH